MITTTRKQLRDIRIGEMLVFTDRSWAVLEEVRRYPTPTYGGHRIVTLAYPDRIATTVMTINGWWDVAL